jgi:hypothetical protein
VTVANPSYSINKSNCPSPTYSIIDTSLSTTPDSIFTLSSSSGLVSLTTGDNTKIKTYSLRLTATMQTVTAS